MIAKKFALIPAFAAAVLSTAMIATPAAAETVRVTHADLDLNTIEGQQKLQQRVDGAIRRICLFDDQGRLSNAYVTQACTRQIRAEMTPKVAALIENSRLGG
ncbi:UrcA family protein [Altererythrobacter xixiisoli]|uniref:UrcA family protein n=1 Tax=Croceibacterium xixiisoli TaxID=1476466 RepID=A0A6I4TRC1_9SPHN|nr:UrcA family protein [Croceibacterium xixiisoli]MXO97457.1 UrcA family protein [Croceibacterium xixiisoli]